MSLCIRRLVLLFHGQQLLDNLSGWSETGVEMIGAGLVVTLAELLALG